MAADGNKPGSEAQDNPLGNILYEGELGNFLSGFIDKETPTAPQNLDEVIARVGAIWQEKGYLQPHELATEMLDSCLPDCQPKVRELVCEMLANQSSPDPLTGFARKEATPLLTGLAHLYGTVTEQPVVMVEGDFGNMGGTNEHFRKLLAAQRGVDVGEVDIEESFPYTDMAARSVARLAEKAFNDYFVQNDIPNGKLAAVRSGGDEIRFIAVGIDEATAEKIINDAVNSSVEEFTARAGLHDHPHAKARSDRYKDGFGAAFTPVQLDASLDPATAVKDADVRIGSNKKELGYLRRGELFAPEAREQSMVQLYQQNPDLLPENSTPEEAAQHEVALLAQQAQDAGAHFTQVKEMTGATYSMANQISLERQPELTPYPVGPEQAAAIIDSVKAVIEGDYADYSNPVADNGLKMSFDDGTQMGPLFQTPEQRREQKLLHTLKNNDIQINPAERRFLKMALEGLSPKDPPTGVNMPKEMPEIAAIFTHDTVKLAGTMAASITGGDKAAEKLFDDAGMQPDDLRAQALCVSFHNLAGVNEAFGHHNADTMLHHMANQVVAAALQENGIDMKDAAIAHEGGARFMVAVKPVSGDMADPAALKIIDQKVMDNVQQSIARRTAALNDTPVLSLLGEHAGSSLTLNGKPVDAKTTFAEIKDPKREYATGIDVSTAARAMTTHDADGKSLTGGRNLYLVRQAAELDVERTRDEKKAAFDSSNKVTSGVSRKWAKNATI